MMHSEILKPHLICQICNSAFYVAKNRYHTAQYCSRDCMNKGRTKPFYDRFWNKVDKTGECWLWTAALTNGYGVFQGSPAHRLAWIFKNGPIPDGLYVCHNCPGGDNRRCVRPEHMFLGTQADNLQDAARKGTMLKGERNPGAKLDRDQVIQIRTLRLQGTPYYKIAKMFGVHTITVFDICRGNIWGWIPYGITSAWKGDAPHPNGTLTIETVKQIRKLRQDGLTYISIAMRLSTTKETVRNVCKGIVWNWVT